MMETVTDAWHTLVPPRGDRHGPLSPFLVTLTVVTGLVDAFSYLVLGHVFVANMTGNVVFLAFALTGAKGFSVAASAFALVAFVLGVVVSGRLVAPWAEHRGRMLGVTVTGQAVLVAASVVVGWSVADVGSGVARYLVIGLLGVAMGMQNGTVRRLGVPDLSTNVMTTMITSTASDSRLAGGSGSRVGRRGLSVAALLVGALIGALVVLHVDRPLDLVLALALLVPVAVVAGRLSRSGPAWDQAV
jgi:uncharacterized membrane protein YoaK (UPF0700 family)